MSAVEIVEDAWTLPLLVLNHEPLPTDDGGQTLVTWYGDNRQRAEELLLRRGALLFRGFEVRAQASLQRVAAELGGGALDYVGGNSPRQKLADGVYTSTEYPPEFSISLHNELSYTERWPARLFFCCVVAPREGGETPLADSRLILARLPPEVRDAFVKKGVMYVRNLHGRRGFGRSWQQTFETSDPLLVEERCRAEAIDFHWNRDESLTLVQVRPATAVHPRTGEAVWFNQADQFHPSTHPPAIYQAMLTLYNGNEDRLPQNARFGDGTPIDVAMLDEIRQTVRAQVHLFSWQEGDLLLVDNMLVCHGREPFKPPRRILVSMT